MKITKLKKGKPYLLTDVKSWGGKGDNLLKLSEVFNVPSGFIISSEDNKEWAENNNLVNFVRTLRNKDPQQAYEEIQRKFLSTSFDRGSLSQLEREFSGVKTPLAVRSSSVNEDGGSNSFAGQHETILGVTNFKEFIDAVKEVYASLFTPRAIEYRRNQGLALDDSIAVVVQTMVNPSVSGVAYSPSPNNLNEILIESTWGLCTSIVDGRTGDIFRVVDTVTGNAVSDISPKKNEMDVYDIKQRKVITKKVPFWRAGKSSLTKEQIIEVAKTVKSIERGYGCPMDMEFSIEEGTGQLYVLQARPITSLQAGEEEIILPDVGTNRILIRSKNIRNQGIFEGPAVVVRGVDHVNRRFDIDGDLVELNKQFKDGYILIAPEVPPQLEQYVTNARAMYATECGTTGHAAAVACEKGIIYLGRGVSSAPNLLQRIRSGDRLGIAVSREEGILYTLN
jgi:pyruvate, water dikinase